MKLFPFSSASALLASIIISCQDTVTVAFTPSALLLDRITSSSFSSTLFAKSSDDSSKSDVAAKKAALDGVLQKIERSYGRGSIVKLGDADRMKVDSISSGALTLGKISNNSICNAY